MKLTPAACWRSRTSPGPGSPISTSSHSRTSGPPVRWTRIACVAGLLPGRLTGQRGEQQQSDDVGDLDHRVDGWAGGVLVRVADRVTGDRGLVRFRALAAVIAVLDIFLGIVPGAAAR